MLVRTCREVGIPWYGNDVPGGLTCCFLPNSCCCKATARVAKFKTADAHVSKPAANGWMMLAVDVHCCLRSSMAHGHPLNTTLMRAAGKGSSACSLNSIELFAVRSVCFSSSPVFQLAFLAMLAPNIVEIPPFA